MNYKEYLKKKSDFKEFQKENSLKALSDFLSESNNLIEVNTAIAEGGDITVRYEGDNYVVREVKNLEVLRVHKYLPDWDSKDLRFDELDEDEIDYLLNSFIEIKKFKAAQGVKYFKHKTFDAFINVDYDNNKVIEVSSFWAVREGTLSLLSGMKLKDYNGVSKSKFLEGMNSVLKSLEKKYDDIGEKVKYVRNWVKELDK